MQPAAQPGRVHQLEDDWTCAPYQVQTTEASRPTTRRGDNWRPLFAIAHLIGWTARLADAAEKIEKAGANDDETIGVMLLADIQAVFETKGVASAPSSSPASFRSTNGTR